MRNTELYLEKVGVSCRLMPSQVLSNGRGGRTGRVLSNHVHHVTINVNNRCACQNSHRVHLLRICESKVGTHPDRITNLYFTYLFMLRALNKAADELGNYEYSTGTRLPDRQTTTDLLGGV